MLNIEIRVQDKRFYWRKWMLKSFCKKVIRAAWQGYDPAEVSLVLADDEFVHILNRDYRNKDCPTNVLSFENAEKPPKGQVWLAGDIIVSYSTLLREAKAQGKTFGAHFAHLLVHGTLHLQGYDHLSEDEAQVMESLETKIMNQLGYEDPYKDVI